MRASRPDLPALLGAGHAWRAAIGMSRARQPAEPLAGVRSVGIDEGSFGYRVSGRKSPGAKAHGENRLRVIQAVGYSAEAPTERSDAKKQTNLYGGDDKLARMYTYGERLRWAMGQAKPPMSGRGLAARVGIRPQSVHYLLDPSRNAKGSRHTTAIARALGVSPEWLATGRGSPHKKNGRAHADHRALLGDCLRAARELVATLERAARAIEDE